jgi:hypothetical protein
MSEETQIASEGQEVETKDQEELKTEDKVETKSEETTEAPAVDEVDYEALLKEKDEKIAKITADKDNYRKMALKYKKGEEEVEPELSDEEKLRAIVKEELFNSDLAQAQREKDDLLAKLVRENKELKIANKNSVKSNLSPGGVGYDSSKKDEEKSEFSPQKIAQLKRRAVERGIDPEYYVKIARKNVGKSDAEKGITINKENGV